MSLNIGNLNVTHYIHNIYHYIHSYIICMYRIWDKSLVSKSCRATVKEDDTRPCERHTYYIAKRQSFKYLRLFFLYYYYQSLEMERIENEIRMAGTLKLLSLISDVNIVFYRLCICTQTAAVLYIILCRTTPRRLLKIITIINP